MIQQRSVRKAGPIAIGFVTIPRIWMGRYGPLSQNNWASNSSLISHQS